MSGQKIIIPRATDSKLIEIFAGLAAESPSKKLTINVPGLQHPIDYHDPQQSQLIDLLRSGDGVTIATMSLSYAGFNVAFERDGGRPGVFDSITLTSNNNTPQGQNPIEAKQRIAIAQQIGRLLHATDPARVAAGADADAQAEYASQHQAIIDRLIQGHSDQIQRINSFGEKLQREHIDRRNELEREFDERKAELDAWHKEQQIELSEEAERLRKLKQDVDDRNNTHVRRELRNQLQHAIGNRAEKFTLSRRTLLLKLPVHLTVVITGAFAGFLLYKFSDGFLVALQKQTSETSLIVILALRSMLSLLALGGLVWFYLRWLSKTFEETARAENRLRQLQLDVDRASWAVEAALEWQALERGDMPEELLRKITHGLFDETSSRSENEVSAAVQLASALVGSASRVKLSPNGSEIEIVKPGRLEKKKLSA